MMKELQQRLNETDEEFSERVRAEASVVLRRFARAFDLQNTLDSIDWPDPGHSGDLTKGPIYDD